MEQLTFGACVKKSWSSARQAIVRMPVLFLGACVVFACIALLSGPLQPTATGQVQFDAATHPSHKLLQFALSILNFVVIWSLTIKVHRFVLLGEGSEPLLPLSGKPLARHAAFSFGLLLLFVLVAALLLLTVVFGFRLKWGGAMLVFLPLCVVFLFVLIRLGLLYPALSLGAPLKLRPAWNDSRGHFWSIWGVEIVVSLPLMAVSTIMFIFSSHMLAVGQVSHGLLITLTVINAVITALLVVLFAATGAWLYLRYAKQLRNEVGTGTGTGFGTGATTGL